MKKKYWLLIIISMLITGCGLTDAAINRAISETQEEVGKIQTAIA